MITFAVLTYNHEKYIIEHLESIKYQILNYGEGEVFELVISDDCSGDNTIYLIEKWIEKNKNLFQNIVVNINKTNEGIVKNYINACKLINGEKFKLLAGDDLYSSKNIINVINDSIKFDVVFSPLLYMNDYTLKVESDLIFKLAFKHQLNVKKLKNMFKFWCYFKAPGSFINKKIISDMNYISFISKYKYIEDYPSWYFVFFKLKTQNIKILDEPYVLYRLNSGISTNSNNEYRKYFLDEQKRLVEEFNCKFKNNNFNIYKNIFRIYQLKYYGFDRIFDKKIREFDFKQINSVLQEEKYLKVIIKNKNDFLNELQ